MLVKQTVGEQERSEQDGGLHNRVAHCDVVDTRAVAAAWPPYVLFPFFDGVKNIFKETQTAR